MFVYGVAKRSTGCRASDCLALSLFLSVALSGNRLCFAAQPSNRSLSKQTAVKKNESNISLNLKINQKYVEMPNAKNLEKLLLSMRHARCAVSTGYTQVFKA